MISIAHNLVGDVRDVGRNVCDIGAVERIRLEEFIPQQNAVFISHVIEVRTGALPNPIADDVEIGERVQMKLCVEPLARDALHGLVESPVAASRHNANAVDRERQVLGVRNLIFDFANAELTRGRVRTFSANIEVQRECVKILRAIAVRPPQLWIREVQLRRGILVELDFLRPIRCNRQRFCESDRRGLPVLPLNGSCEIAAHRLRRFIFQRRKDVQVGAVVRCREIGRDERIFDNNRAGGIHGDGKPNPRVPVTDGRQPIPADRGKKRRAVNRSFASIATHAQRGRVLMRNSGMRLRCNQNCEHGGTAGRHEGGDVEVAADECTSHGPRLLAIYPNLRAVIDAAKMQPYLPALVRRGHSEGCAIPVAGFIQALGNRAHVLAI